MLEMSKLVPNLISKYDFEMVGVGNDWETENFWFIRPTNFHAKVMHRSTS